MARLVQQARRSLLTNPKQAATEVLCFYQLYEKAKLRQN